MTINWQQIESRAQALRTLDVRRDPKDNRVLSKIYSGLRVKLSELVQELPNDRSASLVIWADTLIIDYPSFDALGVIIMARNLDASLLDGAAMPIMPPAAGQTRICQFLIQQTTDNCPFTLTTSTQKDGAAQYTIPVGADPLTVGYFTLGSDTRHSSWNTSTPAELQDLIGRPWALNSLKASFTAASMLMNSSDQDALATAQSMLNWVVACVRSLGEGEEIIPGDFAELYSQAAALLVTLNVRPGTRYVPVLAGDLYQSQAGRLLDTLQSYQAQLDTLDIQGDIQSAIAKVSDALSEIAATELTPLSVDMNNVSQNIDDLANGILALQNRFDMQYGCADASFAVLQFKINDAKVTQYLEAAFKASVGVVKAGVAAAKMEAGDASAGEDILGGVVDAATNGYGAIAAIIKSYPQDSLLPLAKQLIEVQRQLITSMHAAIILNSQIQSEIKANLAKLPSSLGAVSIDPELAWDNYMMAAEAALTNLQRMIGDGAGSDAAQEAATNYLANLKILAQYGKAINAKFVAYTGQLARASVLRAEIAAAETTQKRWQALQVRAESDEEKLAALRGMLKSRGDSIVRNLYVAWNHFRNAYFYLYFTDHGVTFDINMSVAQLKFAFAEMAAWTQRLLDGSRSDRVQLPNRNVDIEFSFPIVQAGAATGSGDGVLLVPAAGGNPASIELTIPIGSLQLQEQLPQLGNVAIWVTTAEFHIDGVKANSKGRVILNVSTSGAYENGFGSANAHSFVTKGLSGYYAYEPASDKVVIKWEVNSDIYMTPSPFTQWSLLFDPQGGDPSEASQLRVKLGVAFRPQP